MMLSDATSSKGDSSTEEMHSTPMRSKTRLADPVSDSNDQQRNIRTRKLTAILRDYRHHWQWADLLPLFYLFRWQWWTSGVSPHKQSLWGIFASWHVLGCWSQPNGRWFVGTLFPTLFYQHMVSRNSSIVLNLLNQNTYQLQPYFMGDTVRSWFLPLGLLMRMGDLLLSTTMRWDSSFYVSLTSVLFWDSDLMSFTF